MSIPPGFESYAAAFQSPSRIASLYSDFRSQRTNNPDGYTANCEAWLEALTAAAADGALPSNTSGRHDRFVLHTGDALARSLQSNRYGIPLALSAVFEQAVRNGDLMPLQEFMKAQKSIHSTTGSFTPWQVITWGLEKAGFQSRSSINTQKKAEFVVIDNLEGISRRIDDAAKSVVQSNVTGIFTREMFLNIFKAVITPEGKSTSDLDLAVLLLYLSRDRELIRYDSSYNAIKFRKLSDTPITQEDAEIASLRSLIDTLERQTEQLNKRIGEFDQTVRKAIAAKNTIAAKTALRSKKLAENTLQQRTTTLFQLQDVFSKIEQAADQVEIVRVMEAAGKTLKSLNEKTGGVERIQDIMDDLKEEMMSTDEIGQALNEDGQNAVDEAEVDDELEALESAERAVRAAEVKKSEQIALDAEAEEVRMKLAALESPTNADKHSSKETRQAQEEQVVAG